MLRLTKRTLALPIIGYSLATFYLVGFIFYLKYLHFPIFLDTVLIGIPFIGRMLTPILYPLSVIKYGMEKILYLSLAIMGIISILEEFSDNLIILIIFRFITGALYGLSTSSAIEMASMTKIRLLIGLTMGGWSIGWIFSALSAFFLSNLMLFTGIISVPFILYPTRRHGINLISTPVNSISTHISKKINIDFSLKAFIIFFLGFEPAFILQIVPSLIPKEAFIETILSYSVALIGYALLPIIGKPRRSFIISGIIVSITGFLSFLTLNIPLFIIFTTFGLGINSLLPILSRIIRIRLREIGPSMNLAAAAGFIIPNVVEIGNVRLNSSVITLLSSLILLVFILFELNKNKITK